MYKKLPIVLSMFLIAAAVLSADAQTHRAHKKPLAKKPVIIATGAVKTQSGLIYLITKKGSGVQPKVGQTVVVHYTGTLTDGVKFDSSRDRGAPFEFPLGAGKVIKGWEEGIGKMRIGDQAILVIPPTLGYGTRGAGGVIPPNATLIFIVELVGVKDN